MGAKKQKTNEEVVYDIMNQSEFGPLAQMFVMDALVKMSNKVAASDPKQYPENGFISAEAWIGCAKEIQTKLKNYRGG